MGIIPGPYLILSTSIIWRNYHKPFLINHIRWMDRLTQALHVFQGPPPLEGDNITHMQQTNVELIKPWPLVFNVTDPYSVHTTLKPSTCISFSLDAPWSLSCIFTMLAHAFPPLGPPLIYTEECVCKVPASTGELLCELAVMRRHPLLAVR